MSVGLRGGSRVRAERRPAAAVPAREAPEQVVVRLRRSGRHLVLPALCFVAVCFGTGFLWGRPMPWAWMSAALPIVAAGLVVLLAVLPVVLWLNRVTIITTRRLIVTQGFLVRERTEFLLGHGRDAQLRRGPVQLLTGSGDVIVHAGTEGTMVLHDLPRARLVHRAVVELLGRAAPGRD